ncbi:MAG: 4Fe-4S dicluster domain-containing protein [Acidilobaceae archaeon]|nr:4Fe-4S dicluster domain-containing protein [Acidilobaceae archaeon]MDW7974281.1 4Fe-4S dicluster domain-containing protein [Sulfolobales archaeon]
MRPVFVVDPKRCVACMACVAACSIEHGVLFTLAKSDPEAWPQTQRLRTWVSWIEREEPRPRRTFMPLLCFHCQDTPCERVCPTRATYKTPEGVVLINKDKCIGCAYCIIACPYGARYKVKAGDLEKAKKTFNMKEVEERYSKTELRIKLFKPPVPNEWATAERAVDKCTLCYHRKELGEWIPSCVEVCPTKARMFGDLDDPNDPVAELVRSGKAKQLRPDLKTEGLVYYVR